jgi:NAD(P)-dependent dehydrogenase (short-subunit alcohol dehydrogenase family)
MVIAESAIYRHCCDDPLNPRIDSGLSEDWEVALQIEGKRIIVTGASSGLGEAAVRVFVREGAAVAALDVQDEAGSRVVAASNEEGPGHAVYHHCDVRSAAAVRTSFERAVHDLGGLDALVHFAGVDVLAPAESITEDDWDFVLDVNLKGTFLSNQAAFRYLRDGGGRIVNVTSPIALLAAPGRAHYAASKGGIASLSRALAAEWGQYGINVVALSPVAHTPMTDRYRATLSRDEQARFDAASTSGPLRRKGDPEADIAPVLVFLVSDASRFITAQIIAVDGGSTPVR